MRPPRYMLASFSSNVRAKSIQRNASRYFSWTGASVGAFFFLGRAGWGTCAGGASRLRWGQLHSDQFAHSALLHCHAVKNIGFGNGAFVVSDDDELTL